ncbi:ABC transporter permease [Brenneria tiliae]|uniref:ABC transporter permease n=1 Tax=Brenneria tiliae TaxID=2914984 RepID=A0ABT0MVB1_9GAMM|nr:ABC transporter permease [Brenneria tiliae]MCL2893712.1 ABC transporter permease [Brenneria tiliae]
MNEFTLPANAQPPLPVRRSLARDVLHKPGGLFGFITLMLFFFMALSASWLAPYGSDAQFVGMRLLPFNSAGHVLGTDELSRDLLSRVLYGAQVSLWVGVFCVGVGAVLGSLIGLFAAMAGRVVDTLLMRACDILLAYPGILFGIIVVAILGPGLVQIGIAVAFVNVPVFARLMRASVLRERELDYIKAARVQGCGLWRLMSRHILPNSLSGVIPQLATAAGHAVLFEASLSFIGLGIKPPTPSWGAMLSQSRDYMLAAPLYAIVPGGMLLLLVFALNQLGDAVQSAFNPTGEP